MSAARQMNLGPRLPIKWEPSPDRSSPQVWIRELLILRKLEPDVSNIIRRIQLKRGLNILWARPSAADEPGLSGHASGKTTFCRILRYLLGEGTFGSEMVRDQIRRAFPDGWVVGEILVEDTPWLVCRSFSGLSKPFATPRSTMSDLFSPALERGSLQKFQEALDDAVVGTLPVSAFASSDKPITWSHVLPWTARDQEARFSALTEWRHRLSQSDSPDPDAEDRNHMLRAMLDLIDPEEQDELRKHAELLHERDTARSNLPLLEHQLKRAIQRLRSDVPGLPADEFTPLTLQGVRQQTLAARKENARNMKRVEADKAVQSLRESWNAAESRLATGRARLEELQELLELAEGNVATMQGKIDTQRLRELRQKHPPSPFYCGVPIEEARAQGCKLADKVPVDFGKEAANARLDGRVPAMKAAAESARQEVARQESTVESLEAEVAKAKQAYDFADDESRRTIRELDSQDQSLAYQLRQIDDVVATQEELDTLAGRIKKLDEAVNAAYARHESLRRKIASRRALFSDTFSRVVSRLLGHEAQAKADLSGRTIQLDIDKQGALTSAAIETLKVLAFDLAALAASMEGRGWHPRFLIHDGPREADMQPSVYHRLFHLARDLEAAYENAPPGFQFIITTTTEPPADMSEGSEWMLDPILSGSTASERLLGTNLA